MTKKIGKRINDGNMTGLKQDRFRNSRFEYEEDQIDRPIQGVSRKSINTISGAYAENRGRRSADERIGREDNPFENGKLYNWNHRKGWDRYFEGHYDKEAKRSHGGALIHHDGEGHAGKGPKGYKRADNKIFDDVCEMLTLNPVVDASEIEVKVKDGCVFLKGKVESREVKRMAELSIENISGVVDVQNLLFLNPNFKDKELH
jgi:osmotically-inducible protein OsmY